MRRRAVDLSHLHLLYTYIRSRVHPIHTKKPLLPDHLQTTNDENRRASGLLREPRICVGQNQQQFLERDQDVQLGVQGYGGQGGCGRSYVCVITRRKCWCLYVEHLSGGQGRWFVTMRLRSCEIMTCSTVVRDHDVLDTAVAMQASQDIVCDKTVGLIKACVAKLH